MYFCCMNFITGATGLVGSHLVVKLLSEGLEVKALRRPHSDLSLINRVLARSFDDPKAAFEKIIWIEGELSDYYSLEEALAGVDFVYHCAARVSFRPADQKKHAIHQYSGHSKFGECGIILQSEKVLSCEFRCCFGSC